MTFNTSKFMPEGTSVKSAGAFVLLHPNDNILVCCKEGVAGDVVFIDGVEHQLVESIRVGHKIARNDLSGGDKVVRYGAPIGSMTQDCQRAFHIHTHNMKSDYISSHGRDAVHIISEGS